MSQVKERSEIDAKYKWNLGDIYATNEKWESTLEEVKAKFAEIAKFKGKLSDEKELKNYFVLEREISQEAEKLFLPLQKACVFF